LKIAQQLQQRGVQVTLETWNPSAGFSDSVKLALRQIQVCVYNLVLEMLVLFDVPVPHWGIQHPKSSPALASDIKRNPAANQASGGIPLQSFPQGGQGTMSGTTSQASPAAGAPSSNVQSSSQGQSSSFQSVGGPQPPASTASPQSQGQGPQVIQISPREDYLMLCIKGKRPFTERSEIRITTLTRDWEVFKKIRGEYKTKVSRWYRFLSLFSVQNIGFVKVQVLPIIEDERYSLISPVHFSARAWC
jgi:hypothetical protein